MIDERQRRLHARCLGAVNPEIEPGDDRHVGCGRDVAVGIAERQMTRPDVVDPGQICRRRDDDELDRAALVRPSDGRAPHARRGVGNGTEIGDETIMSRRLCAERMAEHLLRRRHRRVVVDALRQIEVHRLGKGVPGDEQHGQHKRDSRRHGRGSPSWSATGNRA